MIDDLPPFLAASAKTPRPEAPKRMPYRPRKRTTSGQAKRAQRPPPDPEALIDALRDALPFLAAHDQRFALSLLSYWDGRWHLSKAQWRWVLKLPGKARLKETARSTPEPWQITNGLNVVPLKLTHNTRLVNGIASRLHSMMLHGTPEMVAELRYQEFMALERMNLARGLLWPAAWQDALDVMTRVDTCLQTSRTGGHAA